MKSWIKKLIKYGSLLLGVILIGCSTTAYGLNNNLTNFETQLNRTIILPAEYNNKVFMNGEYKIFYAEDKICSKNNTIYLPLRLVTYLMDNDKEYWEIRWDKQKPDEVVLLCTYKGGQDKPDTVIKLNVGSKKMIYDGKTVELTTAPEKIEGRILLPLRVLGEVVHKQVYYKEGLIFISKDSISFEGAETDKILKEIKERLQDPRKPVEHNEGLIAGQNIHGKSYYTVVDYSSNEDTEIQRLYSQEPGQEPSLIKEIKNSITVIQPFEENTFYYGKNYEDKVVLYAFDLNNNQDKKIGELDIKGMDFSSIVRVIKKDNKTYFIAHYGDWIMGGETLYCVGEGKPEELISAHQFGSILIEKDNIYYSDIGAFFRPNNLYGYNEVTKETKSFGEKEYVYDVDRELESNGGESYHITSSIKYLNDKLYCIGYKEESNQPPSLYSIDIKTNEIKKLTLPTSQFWIINNNIYYIETTTKHLITVDLEGNGKKTLINNSISQAKYHGQSFYYTLFNKEQDLIPGFYKYPLSVGTSTKLSSKTIKEFYFGSSIIYYISLGYDEGLYKIQNGTTICLEKESADMYEFDGEQIVFYGRYDKKIKIMK